MSETRSFDRETARARVLLGIVLPFLETLVRGRSDLGARLARSPGTVQLEAKGSDVAARLVLGDTSGLRIEQDKGEADVRFVFSDVAHLNAFFAGKPVLPRIVPAWGIAKARLMLEAIRLLVELRILEPPSARARASMTQVERGLRVRLVLELVTRAMSQLHRDGWEPAREMSEASPDRIYQWTVGAPEGESAPSVIGAYVRVHDRKMKAGRGVYARKAPFVHFSFPDVDAAFDVLMATDSTMTAFRGGRIETFGPPEYARKMGILMQKVDELLSP